MLVELFLTRGERHDFLAPIPRVPCVGERIVGPDDYGTFEVTRVEFVYEGGFFFEPSRVRVYCKRDRVSVPRWTPI